ncbi:MAG: arginine--tRNA ligase [Chloroflexota bacterium]
MRIDIQLEADIRQAIQQAQTAGILPAFDIPAVSVEKPREPSHGDYATPTPLRLAKLAHLAPVKIAQAIADQMGELSYLGEINVAPPGFINFRLASPYLQNVVREILDNGMDYGRLDIGAGQKAQVECVSANPTGPITLGRTRGGVMGDTLARAMRAAGYDVTLEYYYNDAGRQVAMLGESVKIRYLQQLGEAVNLTDEHYQGGYITEIAQELFAAHGSALKEESVEYFANIAKDKISEAQKASLKAISIEFDVYFREQSLYENGGVWEALETLHEKGYVYEKDNAHWFRTTAFGDDKDRVLVKQSGEPTYRMPDIAYHWDKAQRGFDLVVDIFGPDHHATAPQVLMGVQALGYDPSFVRTVLHQIVSLVRGGQQLKMSTRRGTYVTLDELVAEVGPDPIRYFMISRSGNSEIVFDLDLAVEHSDKNPVYYIQNAHVRCAGIFRKWVEAGFDPDADKDADLSLLTHENEKNFLLKALELPNILAMVVNESEPHHLTFYAYELASLFHPAYETCRVLHSEVPADVRLARLHFYRAAKLLFARVLDLMGMSAPEVM